MYFDSVNPSSNASAAAFAVVLAVANSAANVSAIGLHQIRLDIVLRFAGAGAAHNKDVVIGLMLLGQIADAHADADPF